MFPAVELAVAAVLLFVIWKMCAPKAKRPPKKELCVEQVLKEADQALAFDPLEDARKKPAAIKPLLSVLLEIREKKAEQELREEEHRRIHGPRSQPRPSVSSMLSDNIGRDGLSGRITDPNHPHFPFTEEGRRLAAQQASVEAMAREVARQAQQSQFSAYVDAPRYDVPPADQYINRKPRGHIDPYGT